MTTLTFTRKDLRHYAENAEIEDLTILDFHVANTNVYGFVHSVIFIDEETKITHNLR